MALGMLNQMSATEYFLQHGVGGAFVGARVGRDGFNWQPDCRYIFYDPVELSGAQLSLTPPDHLPRLVSMHFIRTLVCQNAAVIDSSFWGHRTRVLIGGLHETKEAWIAQWSSEASALLDERDAAFWIFVSTSTRCVTVLDRRDVASQLLAHRITKRGYALSEKLLRTLNAAVPEGEGIIKIFNGQRE